MGFSGTTGDRYPLVSQDGHCGVCGFYFYRRFLWRCGYCSLVMCVPRQCASDHVRRCPPRPRRKLTHTCVDCGPCPKDVYLSIDIPKGLSLQEEIEKAIEVIGGARLALPVPPGKGFLEVGTYGADAKRVRGRSHYAHPCVDEEPGGHRGSESCGDGGPRPGGCVGEPTDGEGWRGLLESITAYGVAAMCLDGRRAQVRNVESIGKLCVLRIRCPGFKEEDFEGIEDVFSTKAGAPCCGPAGGVPAEARSQPHVEGVPRALLRYFESDGRRFPALAQCEPEWQLGFFDELPLQEERSLPYGCRHLRREDRTRLGHRDNWVRSSGSLHHLVGLDQLQLVKLARAGATDVRRRLIERAHEGHPEAPRCDVDKDLLGYNINPTRTWGGDGAEGFGDARRSGEHPGGGGLRAPPPNRI